MLKIKTNNGTTCYIEDQDLQHYKDAEILEKNVTPESARAPDAQNRDQKELDQLPETTDETDETEEE